LKEKGFDINHRDNQGITPIELLADISSEKLKDVLLKNGASEEALLKR
jgi:hypothetical protein